MKKQWQSQLSHIKAIAFDLDGTLIDSLVDLANAANAMRVHLSLPRLERERLESYIGDGLGALVRRALTDDPDKSVDKQLWQKGFTFYLKYYDAHLVTHTQPYPGIKECLNEISELAYPMAVVTNKLERFAKKILQQLNLHNYFKIVLGGDSLEEKKPSALPLIHVAQAFQIEPNSLLMVGDSLNDLKAAATAGSPCIGVRYGYSSSALAQLARKQQLPIIAVVDHPQEITEALTSQIGRY